MRRVSDGSAERTQAGVLPKLHTAAYTKNIAKLVRLLRKPNISVNEPDCYGRTALHYACLSGCYEAASEIIHRGNPVDIEARDNKGRSPIFMAIESEAVECVRLITSQGGKVDIEDNNGTPLLHYAVRRNNANVVTYLLKECSADIKATDKNGFAVLHVSAALGLAEMTKTLVSFGALIDPVDRKKRTPLMAAVAGGFGEIVLVLLSCNASLSSVDSHGMTPFDWAEKRHNKRIQELIFEAQVRRKFLNIFQSKEDSKSNVLHNDFVDTAVERKESCKEFAQDNTSRPQLNTFSKEVNSVFQSDAERTDASLSSINNSSCIFPVLTGDDEETESSDSSHLQEAWLSMEPQPNADKGASDNDTELCMHKSSVSATSHLLDMQKCDNTGKERDAEATPMHEDKTRRVNNSHARRQEEGPVEPSSPPEMPVPVEPSSPPKMPVPVEPSSPPKMPVPVEPSSPLEMPVPVEPSHPPEITMTVYPTSGDGDEDVFEQPVSLLEGDALLSDSEEYLITGSRYLSKPSAEFFVPQGTSESHEAVLQSQNTSMGHLWVSDSEGHESNYEMRPSMRNLTDLAHSSSGSDFDNEYVVPSNINLEISRDGEASCFFADHEQHLQADPAHMTREEFETYSKAKIDKLKEKNQRLLVDVAHSVQDAFIMECKADELEGKLKNTASNVKLEKERVKQLMRTNADLEKKVNQFSKMKDQREKELELERVTKKAKDEKILSLRKRLEIFSDKVEETEFDDDSESENLKKKIDLLANDKIKLQIELEEERKKSSELEDVKKKLAQVSEDCKTLEAELDVKKTEAAKEHSKAEEQERNLEASRKYYEEKLIKMNKERVEQLKVMSKMNDDFTKLNQELERVKSEQVSNVNNDKASNPTEDALESSGNGTKNHNDDKKGISAKGLEVKQDKKLATDQLKDFKGIKRERFCIEAKHDALEVSKKVMKDEHAAEKQQLNADLLDKRDKIKAQEIEIEVLKSQMMILEIRLEENEDRQTLMNRKIHQRKLGEELKQRFLLKGEELERELIKLRIDLRYEKEKRRRLSLSDEIKERFVTTSEKLQKELAKMKAVQDSLVEEKCKMLEDLKTRDLKVKEYEKFASKVEEKDKTMQILRDGMSDARQKQSQYMKAYSSAKYKAELYEELVGSNLQLEEELANVNNNLQALDSENIDLKHKYADKETEAACYQAAIFNLLKEAKELQIRLDEAVGTSDGFESQGIESADTCERLPGKVSKLVSQLGDARQKLRDMVESSKHLLDKKEKAAQQLHSLANEVTQNERSRETKIKTDGSIEQKHPELRKEMKISDDEHQKLVRELWQARLSLDKAVTENATLQDAKKNLLAKVEAYKEFAAKHCQNNDDMISLEEVLEENAQLMEENATIAEKYTAKLKEFDMLKAVESNTNKPNDVGEDSKSHSNLVPSIGNQITPHQKVSLPASNLLPKTESNASEKATSLKHASSEVTKEDDNSLRRKYDCLKQKTDNWTQQLVNEMTKMKSTLNETNRKKSVLKEKYEQLKEQVQNSQLLQENLEDLQRKYQCLLEKSEKTENEVVAENSNKEDRKSEQEQSLKEIELLKKENCALQKELDQIRLAVREHEEHKKELSEKLRSACEDAEREGIHKIEIHKLVRELQNVKQELANSQEMKKEYETLKITLESLEKKEKDHEGLKQELNFANKKLEASEEEDSRMSKKLLMEKHANLQEDQEQSLKEIELLKNENNELEKELDQIRLAVREHEEHKKELSEKLRSASEEAERDGIYKIENHKLVTELQNVKKEIANSQEMKKEYEALKITLESLKKKEQDHEGLKQELKFANKKLEASEEDDSRMSKKLLMEKHANLQEDQEQSLKEIELLKNENNELEKELAQIRLAVCEHKEHKKELSEKLRSACEDAERDGIYKIENHKLITELQNVKKELANSQEMKKEYEALKITLESLKKKEQDYEGLKQELNFANKKLQASEAEESRMSKGLLIEKHANLQEDQEKSLKEIELLKNENSEFEKELAQIRLAVCEHKEHKKELSEKLRSACEDAEREGMYKIENQRLATELHNVKKELSNSQEMKKEYEALKVTLESLKKMEQDYEGLKQELNFANKKLQASEAEESRMSKGLLIEKHANLQEDQEKSLKEIELLKNENSEFEKELAQIRLAVCEHKEHKKELSEKLRSACEDAEREGMYKIENQRLATELHNVKKELSNSQEMKKEYEALKVTLESLKKMEQDYESLKQELNFANKKLEEYVTENSEIKNSLENTVAVINNMKKENVIVSGELTRTKEEMTARTNENKQHLNDIEELKSRADCCDRVLEEKSKLKEELTSVQKLLVNLQEDYAALEGNNEKAKADAELNTNEYLKSVKKLEDVCQLLEEASKQNTKGADANRKMQNEVERLSERIRILQQENLDISRTYDQTKLEMDIIKPEANKALQLEEEFNEMKLKLRKLSTESDELLESYRASRAEVENYKHHNTTLCEQLGMANERVEKSQENLERNEQVLEQERNKHNVLVEEKSVINQKLAESNRKLERFSRNYVEMKQKYLLTKSEVENLKEVANNNKELSIKYQSMQQDYDDVMEASSKLSRGKLVTEEHLQREMKENRQLKEEITKIESGKKTEIDRLYNELSKSKDSIKALAQIRIQLEADKVAEKEKFAILIHRNKMEKQSIDAKLQQARMEGTQMERGIAGLNRDIEKKEEQYREMKLKFSELQFANKDLNQNLTLAKVSAQKNYSQWRDLKCGISHKEDKILTLSSKVRCLQTENSQLNAKLLHCLRENDHISRSLKFTEYRLGIIHNRNDELWTQYRESKRECKNLEWTQAKNEIIQPTIEDETRRSRKTLEEAIHGRIQTKKYSNGSNIKMPRAVPAIYDYKIQTARFQALLSMPECYFTH